MQKMFASKEAPRHSWGDLSRYSIAPLPDAVMQDIAQQVASCPSRSATANGSFRSLGWVGGPVVDLFDRRETAYVHRNMLTLLRATPDWSDDAPTHVGRDLLDLDQRDDHYDRPGHPSGAPDFPTARSSTGSRSTTPRITSVL